MRRLAILVLSAGVSIAAAQTATTPTTGPNTTGTPGMGATVPPPAGREQARPIPRERGDNETGTPVAGTATSGPATTGHIPATRPPRSKSATTATTHSGSTPIAADQSDVRTRGNGSADRRLPDTSAGWLTMLFSGTFLMGAGLRSLRARASTTGRR
jgi:hypothetical protein